KHYEVRDDPSQYDEGDLGDAGAGGQRLTSVTDEALHDVQHVRWQQVTNQLGEERDRQRRLLGGLQYHAVAGSQRRSQFPGSHQAREVPRDDLPDHAQRLVEMVRGGVFVDLRGAAFLGPQATGKVAEVVSRQRNVGVQG